MADKQIPQFLSKLFSMTHNGDFGDCISWTEDGLAFWVSNLSKFTEQVLPLYFKHNNYASFVRQLNMYSFKRSTEGKGIPGAGEKTIELFTHPFFQRSREDLLPQIHRKQVASQRRPGFEPTGPAELPSSPSVLDPSDGTLTPNPFVAEQLQSRIFKLEHVNHALNEKVDELTQKIRELETATRINTELIQTLTRIVTENNTNFPYGGQGGSTLVDPQPSTRPGPFGGNTGFLNPSHPISSGYSNFVSNGMNNFVNVSSNTTMNLGTSVGQGQFDIDFLAPDSADIEAMLDDFAPPLTHSNQSYF